MRIRFVIYFFCIVSYVCLVTKPCFFHLTILVSHLQQLMIRHTRCDAHRKNLWESLIKFIIGAKDTIKVPCDMEICNIRNHLWLKQDPHRLGNIFKPIASYVLLLQEFKTFLSRLKSLKVPSEYCGSIGRHIMEKKLGSMKSHDWHMLMQ
jgi:hypothetical protein